MRYLPIILIAFFFYSSLKGQCPDITWNSINYISDTQNLTATKRLDKLQNYLTRIKEHACGNDSAHALLLRKIGFIYSDQSDFINAIKYFRESIQIIASNIGRPAINPRHLINSYYRLSTFYEALNNNREKIRAIDSCISVSHRLNAASEISCIRSLEARAEFYFDLGDYYRCVKDAEMCERLAWIYAANDKKNAELGRGFALISLGWLVEALEKLKEFKKAEELLSGKIYEYEKAGLTYLGFVYSQLAQLEIYKGNYGNALVLFSKALAIERQGGYNFTCKQILNTIGHDIYFMQYNNTAKALQYYNKALRYVNKETEKVKDDAIENVEILTRIGYTYVRQGLYDIAFKYFQQAFDLIKPGITEADILRMSIEQIISFKKAHILAALVISKGDAYLEKYKHEKNSSDVQKAISIYRVADKLLVMLRANQTDLKSKLFWRSASRRLYERAIEACYLSGNADEAFYFSEKSRAVLLNEQLAQQSFLSTEDISNQVQLRKKMLLRERESSKAEVNSKEYLDNQKQLFLDEQIMEGLTQRIKVKYPLYYQSALDTAAIALSDIYHTILKDHQAILEIFSGDSAVYALLITPGKTFLNKIDKNLFETTTDKYIEFIANPSLLNKDFDGFQAIACQLYQLIFQNAPVPHGRIIISPDGRNFPFESLIVKNSSSFPDYFLNDHAVSYTYSARYLLNSFTANTNPEPGNFMGIAPVNFSQQVASLPGSDQSLRRIAMNFSNTHNLVANEASKSSFIKQFTNYSVIQVYTHAAGNGDVKEPVIYFADSVLYLSDLIPENKPVTKLIVLSACETGNGRLYLGEGVFNFNRGFAAYGVPSSVTNLWSVESRATYKLTELFYKYLSRDLPIDIALQRAKKEFIETGSRQEQLPYYWAATILMGKTEAPGCKKQSPSALYFILSGILCLCVFAGIYYESIRLQIISI